MSSEHTNKTILAINDAAATAAVSPIITYNSSYVIPEA